MEQRWSLREMLGIVLVVGAALIAEQRPGHDQRIIETVAMVCAGWIIVAALAPRSMRTVLVIAGVSAVLAAFLASLGQGATALIPLAVTLHHGAIVGWELYRTSDEPHVPLRDKLRQPVRRPVRERAPKLDDDPFRSPPQAPPIVVPRPPTVPSSVPIDRDEAAAKPRLLD